jgi:hypothetical protein
MNPDALSDLVLLLVCAAVLWFHLRQRPAVAMAAGLIGLAACLGVLRYSGWAEMLGPHRFTSLLAACAAFPLLASGLRWPDAPLATRGAAVGRFVLVVGGRRHRADAGRSGALVAGGAGCVCAGDCLDGGAAAQYLGLGGHAGFAGQLCGGGYWQGRQQLPGLVQHRAIDALHPGAGLGVAGGGGYAHTTKPAARGCLNAQAVRVWPRGSRSGTWAAASRPCITSPATMTLGLARPSRAMVVCSSPSVQTAWRCVGRLALCTMATGVVSGRPYSSSSWMWAAPLTPM